MRDWVFVNERIRHSEALFDATAFGKKDSLFRAGQQASGELGGDLIPRIGDECLVYTTPVALEVWIHAWERTFHGDMCLKTKA